MLTLVYYTFVSKSKDTVQQNNSDFLTMQKER